jgi:streptomycin 6-kinase
MAKSFKDSLPAELIQHVTAICGSAGEAWIDGLENNVRDLEDLWSIEALAPFVAGEFNYVAPATLESGELAVLKLAPPYKTVEIFAEAAYLRARDGTGAVKFIAEDRRRRAILIEHALPGRNLTECFKDNEPACVEPAIAALKASLLSPPAESTDVTHLDKWFDRLSGFSTTRFPPEYAIRALQIYEELSAQTSRVFYLHGDFHPGNVVSASREPFQIIDPKGIVGHIGYDIGVFLNNLHWWQEAKQDVEERLGRAVTQFAQAFEIDPFEVRQWAFAQMVLGAWWSFEDMPEFYDNAVAKADVWNV